jgi:hypothetical protein
MFDKVIMGVIVFVLGVAALLGLILTWVLILGLYREGMLF